MIATHPACLTPHPHMTERNSETAQQQQSVDESQPSYRVESFYSSPRIGRFAWQDPSLTWPTNDDDTWIADTDPAMTDRTPQFAKDADCFLRPLGTSTACRHGWPNVMILNSNNPSEDT